MIFFIVFVSLFKFSFINSESVIDCNYVLQYESVCEVKDFLSKDCGPFYNNCPLLDYTFETLCGKMVCEVIKNTID